MGSLMQWSRYFRLVIKKFWIVILLLAVSLGATYYYTKSQPVEYSTKATIILNPQVPSPLVPFISTDSYVSGLADNYSLIIKSDKFSRKVAEMLGFPISLTELKESYSSKLAPNTVFFYISATSSTPEKAQKIANLVTQLFLSDGLNQANNSGLKPKDVLDQTVKNQRDQLEYLQKEIDRIKAQIVQLQEIPGLANQDTLRTLNQQLKDDLDIQSKLVVSISEVESRGISAKTDSAVLIDEAPLPGGPDDIHLSRNLLFAGLLAFMLGIALIILLDYADYTVRSSEDLAQLTGYNTLGVVPIVRGATRKEIVTFAADGASPDGQAVSITEFGTMSEMLIAATESKTGAAEAYRALRTNIMFSSLISGEEEQSFVEKALASPDDDTVVPTDEPLMKTFLVTSPVPKEGKSLTTANLAIAFAKSGSRVILVDADMRKPSVHSLFGLPNERGLSDLILARPGQIDQFLKKTPIPELTIITAGTPPSNPSELLTSIKAAKVIAALRKFADIVIIDSPPVVLVSDAAILANRVDSVLLLVKSGSTRRDAITKAVNNLKKVGANVMGVVLNRISETDDGGYYYYSYSGYGYGGKSSSNSKKKEKTSVTNTTHPSAVVASVLVERPVASASEEVTLSKEGQTKEQAQVLTRPVSASANNAGRLLLSVKGSPLREYELKQEVTTLGRQAGNDLVLKDEMVSRRHAQLLLVQGKTLLMDLGSTQGTFVNGRKITPHEKIELYAGDEIILGGDTTITFIS